MENITRIAKGSPQVNWQTRRAFKHYNISGLSSNIADIFTVGPARFSGKKEHIETGGMTLKSPPPHEQTRTIRQNQMADVASPKARSRNYLVFSKYQLDCPDSFMHWVVLTNYFTRVSSQ